jgi:hypothetical protein
MSKQPGDYFEDLEAWENSFSCGGCGIETDVKDFNYQRTCASGEIWTCKGCDYETQVSEKPNEDDYFY